MSVLLLTHPVSLGDKSGVRANAAPAAPAYTRRDYLSAAGEINDEAVAQIAAHKAQAELVAYARTGWVREFEEVYAIVHGLEHSIAVALRNAFLARQEMAKLTPHERLIRSLELRLYILENGMALPRDQAAIDHYRRLIEQAKAAAPNDPAVILADRLEAAE